MRTLYLLFTFITVCLLSSCAPKLTPFTTNLQKQNKWSEDELKKIQYYVSEDIVLRRFVKDGETAIESGQIKIIDGKKVEEVIIKKGTPGIIKLLPAINRFGVAFEMGGDERFLMFGPHPKHGGAYRLLSKEKTRRGDVLVSYDNKLYRTSLINGVPTLLINLTKKNKHQHSQRVASGLNVD